MVTGSKNLTTTASRGADVFAYVEKISCSRTPASW